MEWEPVLFPMLFQHNLAAGNKEEKLVPHDQSFPQIIAWHTYSSILILWSYFSTPHDCNTGGKRSALENTRVENFALNFLGYQQGFGHTAGS